jgi:hypothetical protein
MHLGVLQANLPARRFYESLGGTIASDIVDELRHGIRLPMLRYSWYDVMVIAR